MPPKCRPDVAAARAQTERMLKEAEKAIGAMPSVHAKPQLSGPREFTRKGPRSAEHCTPRLESAKAVFTAAGENADPMAQRDGYVRAAYQAGQALSCARTTQIGKKLGRMPTVKTKKKAEP